MAIYFLLQWDCGRRKKGLTDVIFFFVSIVIEFRVQERSILFFLV